jgi:hypothetical protein
VVLPHLRQAEAQVLDAADPLGAVDHAALRRRHDLAAGQVDGLLSHALVDLGHDARLPAFHALEVGQALDRPLEPAQRLRARRQDGEREHVELQLLLVELPPQLEAARLVDPAEEVHVVHAGDAGGRVGEQRRRLVLAHPVVGDAVPAVDHLLVRGVEDLEGRHDLAGGQRLDLHLPRGELVDALGEELEVVLQREARRPGGLHLEVLHGGGLRACRGCESEGRGERHDPDCRFMHCGSPFS